MQVRRRIDEVCELFAAAWLSGQRPDIAFFAQRLQGVEHAVLVEELVRRDLHFRHSAGEVVGAADYLRQFPDHPAAIHKAFQPRSEEEGRPLPTTITLDSTAGPLAGQQFAFDERTTCLVGRSTDCGIVIPVKPERRTISRHHCLLDINPPDVRIRDFGSLNGTYVNGNKIGQRRMGIEARQASATEYPVHDLKHGDEFQLGDAIFRVTVHTPICCVKCGAQIAIAFGTIPPAPQVEVRCQACGCHTRHAATAAPAAETRGRVCANCGWDVSTEAGDRPGEYLCKACRSDPLSLVRQMLDSASAGLRDRVAIEGYEILRELGRGGMGVVYLARNEHFGTEVALKVMLPQVAVSGQAAKRFLREIETTKVLNHAHVVRLHESGCYQGVFFLTLEFCNGGDVMSLLQALGRPLRVDEALPIILQMLDGLSYAHGVELNAVPLQDGGIGKGRGLVHRDIKPANIMLCRSPGGVVAKVGDYGLAKAFDLAGLSGHTYADSTAGTAHFMPRQQVLQFKYAKPEVDVWAAAASLYYMLTGQYPRDFNTSADPWQTVLMTNAVPILQRGRPLPKRLARVIDEALRDNPDIQVKSAAELKGALERI